MDVYVIIGNSKVKNIEDKELVITFTETDLYSSYAHNYIVGVEVAWLKNEWMNL